MATFATRGLVITGLICAAALTDNPLLAQATQVTPEDRPNGPAAAAEPNVLRWVPGSCNAVAVIHMRKLVNSPLGKREKWADEVRRQYAEGLLSAPPWVREVVRATMIGASAKGATAYSIYLMDQQSVIADIARH